MGGGARGTHKSGLPCTPPSGLWLTKPCCALRSLPALPGGRRSGGSFPMLASLIACSSETTFASQWHEHEHQASLMITTVTSAVAGLLGPRPAASTPATPPHCHSPMDQRTVRSSSVPCTTSPLLLKRGVQGSVGHEPPPPPAWPCNEPLSVPNSDPLVCLASQCIGHCV